MVGQLCSPGLQGTSPEVLQGRELPSVEVKLVISSGKYRMDPLSMPGPHCLALLGAQRRVPPSHLSRGAHKTSCPTCSS